MVLRFTAFLIRTRNNEYIVAKSYKGGRMRDMVRNYKPKTDRIHINEDNIKHAIREVLLKTLSIRKAADKYGIKFGTLQNRIKKSRKSLEASKTSSSIHAAAFLSNTAPSSSQIIPAMEMAQDAVEDAQHAEISTLYAATATSSNTFSSKYTVAQVFSTEQEKALTQYLLNCSKMDYGLTLKQLLTLAYKYAESSGCKYPKSWQVNKRAGKDWAAGFRKRNPELSLRKETTNATKSNASNKTAEATINKFIFNDDLALTDTFNTADMTVEAEKQDAHFVDTEISQKNEPVDLEVIKSSTLEVDLEPVSDTDDPLNFFSLKGILTPEQVRPHPKKSVTENVLKRKRKEKGRSRIYIETPEKNSLKSFRKELQKLKQQVKELKMAKKLLESTEVKKANTMTSLRLEIDTDSSNDEVVIPSNSDVIEMPAESEDEEQTNDNISQTESLLQTKIEVDSDVDQRYENEPEASTSNPWWSASASRTSPDDVPLKLANEHSKRLTDNKNRFKVFGEYVGIRLQELPQQQRILAEKVINEALYLAEMGNLTTSHSVRN